MADEERVAEAPAEAPVGESESGEDTQSLSDALGDAYDEALASASDDAPEDVPEGSEGDAQDEGAGEEETPEPEEAAEEPGEPATPEHWAADDRAAFEKLPPEAKQPYLDARKSLERGFQAKFDEIATIRKDREAIDEMFGPVKDDMARAGLDTVGAVRHLIGWRQFIMTKPEQAIAEIAKTHGVDLRKLSGEDAAEPEDEIDPATGQKISEINSRIENLEKTTTKSQEAAAQQVQREALQLIDTFKAATDDAGAPKHPHFDAVRQGMQMRLRAAGQQGIRMTLEDAYDAEVYANPDTRKLVLEEQTRAQAAKRGEALKKDVQKAKKASKHNVQPAGGTAKAAPKKTWADEIGDVYDQAAAQ